MSVLWSTSALRDAGYPDVSQYDGDIPQSCTCKRSMYLSAGTGAPRSFRRAHSECDLGTDWDRPSHKQSVVCEQLHCRTGGSLRLSLSIVLANTRQKSDSDLQKSLLKVPDTSPNQDLRIPPSEAVWLNMQCSCTSAPAQTPPRALACAP